MSEFHNEDTNRELTASLLGALDNSPFGLYIIDQNERFLYVSEATCAIVGVTAEEIYKDFSVIFKYIHDEDRDKVIQAHQKARDNQTTLNIETRITLRGQIKWYWIHSEPMPGIDGNLIWYGTIIDINAKKKTELQLYEQLERYNTFVAVSNTGAWEYDETTDRLWFSDSYLKMIGLDPVEYRENHGEKLLNWLDLMHPDDRDISNELFQNYLSNPRFKGSYENYFRIRHKNGNWVWIWSRGERLFDEDGRYLNKIVGTHIDISETKKRELQLRENERKYRIASEYSPNWDYWRAPDGRYEFVSPGCFDVCGYTASQIKENPNLMEEMILPEDLWIWKRHLQEEVDHTAHFEETQTLFRIRHKDGSIRWIEHDCKPVFDENLRYMGQRGANRDVTMREVANLEVQKLFKGVHFSPISVVITDLNGTIEYVNQKFTEVSGFAFEEVIGKNPNILKSGDKSREDYEKIWATIKSGKTWSGEFVNIRKDGTPYNERGTITPIENDMGEITHFLALKEDVTERKEQEKNLAEVVRIVSEQNSRLVDFAYITSHLIRSHASNFSGLITELKQSIDHQDRQSLLNMLETVSDELMDTIDNLNENLQVQREVNLEREPVNVHKLVPDAVEAVKRQLSATNLEIRNLIPDALSVDFNKKYLNSIFSTLLTNAVKYRDETRPCVIKITSEVTPKDIRIHIQDNGLGIDLDRHKDRIFKMGQVFHDIPGSRGLSLFVAQNQMEAMGGKITVKSQPGIGSTFTLHFRVS
jgi:PAS domain S-box-containing protein